MDYCAQCNSCSEACHLYEMSGKNEMYRPNFRSEIFRRIYKQYVKKEPFAKWRYGDMRALRFDATHCSLHEVVVISTNFYQ